MIPDVALDALTDALDAALVELGASSMRADERKSVAASVRAVSLRADARPEPDLRTSAAMALAYTRRVDARELAARAAMSLRTRGAFAACAAREGRLTLATTERAAAALETWNAAPCEWCGKFFALHSGGLRRHRSESKTCGAEASGESEASDESAATAVTVGSSSSSSSSSGSSRGFDHTWRGKGRTRPRIKLPAASTSRSPFLEHLASTRDLDAAVASSFDFVNAVDAHMSSPMMWAAGSGNVDVVKRLAELNVETATLTRRKDRRAPIHWAARNGRLETIEWLCANTPASPRAMTRDGDYPFHFAVWKMHFRCAEWLAANAPETALSTNRFGCNALLWACSSDADEDVVLSMARWLIEIVGVPFDVVNVHGHSAVHKCAIYGHGKVIDYVLSRGDEGSTRRRLTRPDDRNESPSDLARVNGFDALAEKLENELMN